MQTENYPVLHSNPDILFLDASAAFPVHESVRDAVVSVMESLSGNDSKGSYTWAQQASRIIADSRRSTAKFIGCEAQEIAFVHSASEAAKLIIQRYMQQGVTTLVYSQEDHTSVTVPIDEIPIKRHSLIYGPDGVLIIPNNIDDDPRTLFVVSHIHHLYGAITDIAKLRTRFPRSKIIVDASQSISRMVIDVAQLDCDALFFSAQKIGGIGGVGVVYIKDQGNVLRGIEPHTLPLHAIAALHAAIEILNKKSMSELSLYLDRLTTLFISNAHRTVPGIVFSKGPAHSQFSCSGNGIVSFKIEGYSSLDIAMMLEDKGIYVRAADHCVDESSVDRDVVRVSMQAYTTSHDVDRLVSALANL